jgi:hypothetical protein
MITDPVPDESGREAWVYPGCKVIRGSCIFTSHEDLQNFGARDACHAPRKYRDAGCGLRLSQTLPCNDTTGVVR